MKKQYFITRSTGFSINDSAYRMSVVEDKYLEIDLIKVTGMSLEDQ